MHRRSTVGLKGLDGMGAGARCASLVGGVLAALSVGTGVAAAKSASVYVANDLSSNATVTQFDIRAGGVLSPKAPPTAATAVSNPDAVAIAPDGKSVYVVDAPGDVSQYDVGPGGVLSAKTPATVAAGANSSGIAVSPDGKSVYVASQAGSISQYDVGGSGALSPKTPPAVSVPGGGLSQVAVSPDGKSAYVTDFIAGDVLQYDVGVGGVLSPKTAPTVASGVNPEGIAVSPDDTSVYVVNRGEKDVALFHIGVGGALSKVGTTVAGTEPTFVTVSADGKNVYVVDRNGAGVGAVLQYDVASGGVLVPKTPAAVAAGMNAAGIAVSPDGKSIYVSGDASSDVSQYDAGTAGGLSPKTPATVAAGLGPAGVAVLPDQGPVASFTASTAPGSASIRLDGSASSDPDGSIARYDWNFGDGTTADNGGATPTHTYTDPGTYTVTLTVTDDGGCSTAFVFTGQTASCNGGPAASTSATVTLSTSTKPPGSAAPGSMALHLTGAFESARRWREGNALSRIARGQNPPVGTTFGFTVDEPATMRLAFTQTTSGRRVARGCIAQNNHNQRQPKCARTMIAASLQFAVRAGSHRLRFQGRISSRRRLTPGRYTLVITAINTAGQRSAQRTLTFTIVKQ